MCGHSNSNEIEEEADVVLFVSEMRHFRYSLFIYLGLYCEIKMVLNHLRICNTRLRREGGGGGKHTFGYFALLLIGGLR